MQLATVVDLFCLNFNLCRWIDDHLAIDELLGVVLQLIMQRRLFRREWCGQKGYREQTMATNHFQVLAVQAK